MSAKHIRDILDILNEAESRAIVPTSKGGVAKGRSRSTSPVKLGRNVGADDAMMRHARSKLDPDAAGEVMRRARDLMPKGDGDDHDLKGAQPGAPSPTGGLPSRTGGLPALLGGANWHPLPTLPGYRDWFPAFKPVFEQMGMDVSNIRVATTLTSNEADIKNLMGAVREDGVRQDNMEINLGDIDPRLYNAKCTVYHLDDEVFMLMEEGLGRSTNYYVYRSPLGNHKKLGVQGRPALR